LWRAVDQDGNVLDILVQSRRNKAAARKFFRRLLRDLASVPRAVITDKLGSYDPARRAVLPGVEHRRHKGLNNRCPGRLLHPHQEPGTLTEGLPENQAGRSKRPGQGRWGRCDTGEDVAISVTLAWQVCTETDCLVPQTTTVSLPLRYRP